METYNESIWKQFLGQYSVVKELNAIRPKEIIMEDVLDWLILNSRDFAAVYEYKPDEHAFGGYHEMYYDGVLKINQKFYDVKIAWAEARVGIPTLSISVDSQEEWRFIRQALRDAGLARKR